MITPSFADFTSAYHAGRTQALVATVSADLDTPVAAMLKLGGSPYAFLFESVEGGETRGRYSVIGLAPDAIWKFADGACTLETDSQDVQNLSGTALESLRKFIDDSRFELPDGIPAIGAGVFGYMGYDIAREIERLPGAPPDALGIPDSVFVRPSVCAAFDSVEGIVHIIAPVRPAPKVSAQVAYDAGAKRINTLLDTLRAPLPAHPVAAQGDMPKPPQPASNTPRNAYLAMVARTKELIHAGDIFQATISQRFETPFAQAPFALYRALRRINPSPYLYFMDMDGFAIVGSSPEILVRCQGGRVSIRPIAGTRPRAHTVEEDKEIAEELLADPKERAEHLMLLDLARNDVGRVSRLGSVEVPERFALQYTSHLIHIVSHVDGELAPDCTSLDALLAGFPAGTVSGAPKIRAMEIIDEFEKEKRGLYAGAVGYFSANGDMDSCIALRTALLKDGKMYVQAGGGIVADSEPEREYEESVNKAKALFVAAAQAEHFERKA